MPQPVPPCQTGRFLQGGQGGVARDDARLVFLNIWAQLLLCLQNFHLMQHMEQNRFWILPWQSRLGSVA